MVRTPHWRVAAPLIQDWVRDRFQKSGHSPWEYVNRQVTLEQMGIHRTNFLKELAPRISETKREDWDEIEWWAHVSNRIFYLFHRAADKADRSKGERRHRCWAEWSGPIPPNPADDGEGNRSLAVMPPDNGGVRCAPALGAWDQVWSRVKQVTDRFRAIAD